MRSSVLFLALCLWIVPTAHAAKLFVNATPNDAKIQLLSHKVEFSQGVELTAGRYYLLVSKKGYQRYLQPIVLKNEDVTLEVNLQQTAFPLTVTVTPTDAQIRILNLLEKFEQNMLLSRGKYEVEVRKPGYVTQRQVIEVKEQAVNLTVDLAEVTSPPASPTVPITIQPTYPLYVYTSPKDAVIELADTAIVFQQGIALPTGIYHLRVSQTGYSSRHEWVTVREGKNKVKIELSEPNSCYFAETKLNENQEVASILYNVMVQPRNNLLEVNYYEHKMPSSEATHLEFIGMKRGSKIDLIGTFDNNGVPEEITAELLLRKDNLSLNFKGQTVTLNQTQCQ